MSKIMQHHTIDIDNVNIHYVEAETGDKVNSPRQTMVFLYQSH